MWKRPEMFIPKTQLCFRMYQKLEFMQEVSIEHPIAAYKLHTVCFAAHFIWGSKGREILKGGMKTARAPGPWEFGDCFLSVMLIPLLFYLLSNCCSVHIHRPTRASRTWWQTQLESWAALTQTTLSVTSSMPSPRAIFPHGHCTSRSWPSRRQRNTAGILLIWQRYAGKFLVDVDTRCMRLKRTKSLSFAGILHDMYCHFDAFAVDFCRERLQL